MTRQELQSLIDRVIGKKGIMRSSAWWVRKLFNGVVGYLEKYAESYANDAVKKVKITSDTEMSDESTNPVQNKAIKAYVDDVVSKVNIVVDATMSDNSENPVQNKVIKAYVDELQKQIVDDVQKQIVDELQKQMIDNEKVVAYSLSDLKRDLAKIEKRIDLLEAK